MAGGGHWWRPSSRAARRRPDTAAAVAAAEEATHRFSAQYGGPKRSLLGSSVTSDVDARWSCDCVIMLVVVVSEVMRTRPLRHCAAATAAAADSDAGG